MAPPSRRSGKASPSPTAAGPGSADPHRDRVLVIQDRQRTRRVHRPGLRRLLRHLLENELQCPAYELCFHLVGAREMAAVNEAYLGHHGSTDVITFDHSDGTGKQPATGLHGEIFISLDDAVAQARQFGTTWQAELARYAAHGLLHLAGYDDLQPTARRRMKRVENRLVNELARDWGFRLLSGRRARR